MASFLNHPGPTRLQYSRLVAVVLLFSGPIETRFQRFRMWTSTNNREVCEVLYKFVLNLVKAHADAEAQAQVQVQVQVQVQAAQAHVGEVGDVNRNVNIVNSPVVS